MSHVMGFPGAACTAVRFRHPQMFVFAPLRKCHHNLVLSICLLGKVGRFALCERFVIQGLDLGRETQHTLTQNTSCDMLSEGLDDVPEIRLKI